MEINTRVVPVQKGAHEFEAGDRVWFDRELRLATAEETGLLFGLAAAPATRERFAVLVHVPVADPKDLKVIQCVGTGRRVADGNEIVQPVMVHRRFKKRDCPDADRHPVEFLEECLQVQDAWERHIAATAEQIAPFGNVTADELMSPVDPTGEVQDTAAEDNHEGHEESPARDSAVQETATPEPAPPE